MEEIPRATIVTTFIRIARDVKWRWSGAEVAQLTAKVLGIHPMQVAFAIGMSNMDRVAAGEHPACHDPACVV